jgi:hypothetical protein
MQSTLKTLISTLSLTALSVFAAAAHADIKNASAVQDYTHSTKLDIAKVTHTPALGFCGVQPVEISYVDHKGDAHTLRYESEGNACLGDN